jgi:hypothetical protein
MAVPELARRNLAADFARRAPRPTCWLKVDGGDSTLGVFCRYLTTTLKSHCPSLDERHMLQIAESDSRDHAGLLAEALVFN